MNRREFFLAMSGTPLTITTTARGCPEPASKRTAPAYMIAALCREDKEQLNRVEAVVKLLLQQRP